MEWAPNEAFTWQPRWQLDEGFRDSNTLAHVSSHSFSRRLQIRSWSPALSILLDVPWIETFIWQTPSQPSPNTHKQGTFGCHSYPPTFHRNLRLCFILWHSGCMWNDGGGQSWEVNSYLKRWWNICNVLVYDGSLFLLWVWGLEIKDSINHCNHMII